MEISFQISWRRSWSNNKYCDSSTIASGTLIGDYSANSLSCYSGCSGTVGSLRFKCTDFSISEDWSYGGNTIYYTFPASTTITIRFSDCCWVAGFSSWNLGTTFSTIPRSDTNVINSTPRAITSPVVDLQEGCTHTIAIPVTDPDDDDIRCRWAVGSECSGACNGIPGAILDSSTCIISYIANQGTGYKAVALAIEDFMTPSSSTPLSTVNLQFLVNVFSSSQSCAASPVFISPTLGQGVCVAIAPGDTFMTRVVADTLSPIATITEITTVSPSGTIKGSVTQIGSSNEYYVDITWTPTAAQQGQTHLLCYTAVNSYGLSSEQICIKIDAGLLAPVADATTLMPASEETVSPSNTTWSLQFDRNIHRPTTSARITFHDAATKAIVYSINVQSSLTEATYVNNNTIQITPAFTFPEKQSFYINFEQNIAVTIEGCEPGNEPITSESFWKFETKSISDPVNAVIHPVPVFYYRSEVTLTCFVTGMPTPTVNWYRDGTLVSSNNEISLTQTTMGTNVTSELTIPTVLYSHEGTYTCSASNTLPNGTATASSAVFTLEISGGQSASDYIIMHLCVCFM